jgi:hypothetical protein
VSYGSVNRIQGLVQPLLGAVGDDDLVRVASMPFSLRSLSARRVRTSSAPTTLVYGMCARARWPPPPRPAPGRGAGKCEMAIEKSMTDWPSLRMLSTRPCMAVVARGRDDAIRAEIFIFCSLGDDVI